LKLHQREILLGVGKFLAAEAILVVVVVVIVVVVVVVIDGALPLPSRFAVSRRVGRRRRLATTKFSGAKIAEHL